MSFLEWELKPSILIKTAKTTTYLPTPPPPPLLFVDGELSSKLAEMEKKITQNKEIACGVEGYGLRDTIFRDWP